MPSRYTVPSIINKLEKINCVRLWVFRNAVKPSSASGTCGAPRRADVLGRCERGGVLRAPCSETSLVSCQAHVLGPYIIVYSVDLHGLHQGAVKILFLRLPGLHACLCIDSLLELLLSSSCRCCTIPSSLVTSNQYQHMVSIMSEVGSLFV